VKIIKKLILLFSSFLVVIALLVYVDAVRRSYDAYEKDTAGYVGLNIGAPADEALYVFGVPQEVFGPPERVRGLEGVWSRVYQVDGKDPKNALPQGQTVKDYNDWQFDRDNHHITVTFDPKTRRVKAVGCYVDLSRWDWECPRIFGVNTETHEDEVRERLGQPSWVKHDGVNKSLGYDDVGLELTLTQQRVFKLEKHAATGATWQWKLKHLFL